jgi:hypothetical protein
VERIAGLVRRPEIPLLRAYGVSAGDILVLSKGRQGEQDE